MAFLLSLLEHSCSADLERALRRLEWHLGRYRCVADPASYYYAANILAALQAEQAEARGDAPRVLATVTDLSQVLQSAVREWRDGEVP